MSKKLFVCFAMVLSCLAALWPASASAQDYWLQGCYVRVKEPWIAPAGWLNAEGGLPGGVACPYWSSSDVRVCLQRQNGAGTWLTMRCEWNFPGNVWVGFNAQCVAGSIAFRTTAYWPYPPAGPYTLPSFTVGALCG